MANTGFKGIDVRQTGNQIVFRASLKDTNGAKVTSGTTSVYLYEVQSDGTLASYDWADNTFKTGALTTETASATHRTGNNSTTNTGVWTYALSTLTGFTTSGIYLVVFSNSSAVPPQQEREFQYGSAEGNLVVGAAGEIQADAVKISGDSTAADNAESFFDGTGYAGTNNVIPTVTNTVQVNGTVFAANTITHLNTIFDTDYASIYDTTNKAFLSKLGNFAMGGSSLALTTGAIACTTITASGAVALQDTVTITGTTAFGAITSTGITVTSASGNAVRLIGGGAAGHGLMSSGSGTGDGVHFIGGVTGRGVVMQGGATSGDGCWIGAETDGDGLNIVGAGSGVDMRADITGSLSGNVGSISGITFPSGFNTLTVASIADGVWDEATSGHVTSGTTGAAIVAAGSAGDPWSTSLPGAYGSGTAGKIVGDNLNATVSSRAVAGDAMALTSGERTSLAAVIWNSITSGMSTVGSIGKRIVDYLTGDVYARLGAPAGASAAADIAAIKTDTAAILLDTDSLDTTKITTARADVLSDLINGGRLDLLIDAIKAKTDNLPASPAAAGDEMDMVDAPNATAIDAIVLALLKRDWTGITGESARSTLNALRALRNKFSVSGDVLTVTKEDDATSAWTAAVTSEAGADPITAVDPT